MSELQVGERLYAEALTTIETLNGLRPPLPSDDPLIKAAADIRAAISGGNDLIFTGQIAHQSESGVGPPHWRHRLLRRKFAVIPDEGSVQTVEIRCKTRRTKDVIRMDKAWQIPDQWGTCDVFVFGELDARFMLVELPRATPAESGEPVNPSNQGLP